MNPFLRSVLTHVFWVAITVLVLTAPSFAAPVHAERGKNQNNELPKISVVYNNPDMDLTFVYPEGMTVRDRRTAMEKGHEAVYGEPGSTDPEHRLAASCTQTLLDLTLPKDKAPQRMADIGNAWLDISEEYRKSRKPEPIFATIFLVELDNKCRPKGPSDDDILRSIALGLASAPGIQSATPVWYKLGKQKIHMNAGAGRLIVNGKLAPAPILVMAITTKWRGHMLAWTFTSNDLEMFNLLIKSAVAFGKSGLYPMCEREIVPRDSSKNE